METKYPNTLISSREDKKLVYADDVYSKYYSKSIEDKVMDLDNNQYTIKNEILTNKKNINDNEKNIKYIKGTIEHITNTLSTEYYTNTEVDNKLGNIIENTWCTKELLNCSNNDDTHKLYVGRIDIPKNISNINYFTTITIKLAKDATNSNSLKIRVLDSEDNFIADSSNYIIQSDNINKYVTWYFDPIIVPQNGVHIRFIDLNNKYDFLRVHGSMDNVGITCLGMDLQVYTMCPAIGFNVTPLVHLDLYNKFVSLNV